MATSENSCVDNYSIPQGPAGPQGVQGLTGPVGLTGPQGTQGIQGPSGTSKIDINIQDAENPYTDILSTSELDVAYFILPTSFGATQFKVITSTLAFNAAVSIKVTLYQVAGSGALTEAGSVTIATTPQTTAFHKFSIDGDSSLTLPATETMMKLTVEMIQGTPTAGTQEARIYAFEMR